MNEIECFIEKDKKTNSGFYRANSQYKYNNSYAIVEHYDLSKYMVSKLGIIGVGIMIIEIPGYNISKNIAPFINDDVTSPPTWLDINILLKVC